MEESIKKAFKKAKFESNDELKDNIWHSITLREKKIAYFKIFSFASVSLASLVGLVPMFKILINDFTQSGFYEYLSLAFSNGGLFSSYWKEFAFSLLESLPTISIVLLLIPVFIFFLSLRYLMKQIIKGQLSVSLQVRPV